MSIFHLEKIFNPESIAVIGASADEFDLGIDLPSIPADL
jgi:acyl-CoA synthetase (NDP forming)